MMNKYTHAIGGLVARTLGQQEFSHGVSSIRPI